MGKLKTSFAGLTLRNPLIIGSSGLTNSAEKNKKLEDAGAGALVLKSIFEEQITHKASSLVKNEHPEDNDYMEGYLRSHYLSEYIRLLKETKMKCHIPVIASINCYSNTEWVEFATLLGESGADALELNILALPATRDYVYGSFEQQHIDILRRVKAQVSIPVILKLGNNFTNPVKLIDQLYANGAAGVVLFNRMHQPDINIHTLQHSSGEVFSHPGEVANALRWIGLGSAAVPQIDLAASGGVADGNSMIKVLLAGASAAEVCSVIYRDGMGVICPILNDMEAWMEDLGYTSICQFKGTMNAHHIAGIDVFERTQFLKYFENKEEAIVAAR
ncbi:MAG: dihydroorotate dehydrogenase-like protein [Alistipes sp.]